MKNPIELKLDPVSRRIITGYLAILLIAGLILFAIPFWQQLKTHDKSSWRYQYYDRLSHYWNRGAFSGLLQKIPPTPCHEQEFNELKTQFFYAQHPKRWLMAVVGSVLLLLSLTGLFKLYHSNPQE